METFADRIRVALESREAARILRGLPVSQRACSQYVHPDAGESPRLMRIGASCARCGMLGPWHVRESA
jgi:hypothetical protein